jgi:hypothetical protein
LTLLRHDKLLALDAQFEQERIGRLLRAVNANIVGSVAEARKWLLDECKARKEATQIMRDNLFHVLDELEERSVALAAEAAEATTLEEKQTIIEEWSNVRCVAGGCAMLDKIQGEIVVLKELEAVDRARAFQQEGKYTKAFDLISKGNLANTVALRVELKIQVQREKDGKLFESAKAFCDCLEYEAAAAVLQQIACPDSEMLALAGQIEQKMLPELIPSEMYNPFQSKAGSWTVFSKKGQMPEPGTYTIGQKMVKTSGLFCGALPPSGAATGYPALSVSRGLMGDKRDDRICDANYSAWVCASQQQHARARGRCGCNDWHACGSVGDCSNSGHVSENKTAAHLGGAFQCTA